MLTTTAFLRPDAGTTPLPTIVRSPSRDTSPISAQTLLVPTSIPTSTASRSTRSRPRLRLDQEGLSGCCPPVPVSIPEYWSRLPDQRDDRQPNLPEGLI